MKSTQKLMAFIISVSIILQLFVLPMPASAARDPYITFSAVSYDSYEEDSSKITFASDRVGTIASGDWLCFKALDFGEYGAYKVDITTAHPKGHGAFIRLRLDSPDSEIFVDVPYVTSDYSKPVISSALITKSVNGVHDLYVSSSDAKINFLDMTFYEKSAPGGFRYEPYKNGRAFQDLDGSDCAQSVDMLYALGIIPERSDGLYRPDVETSRGEFAYSIFRLYQKAPGNSGDESQKVFKTKFTDVDPASQYAEAIAYLSDLGIMNGVSATEFDPYSYITLNDAVVVAMRVLGYSEIAAADGGYMAGYLKTSQRVRIGTNVKTNDGYLSRGDMAILIDNLINEDCLVTSSVSGDSVSFDKDVGILASAQNVYPATGVVAATAATAINMPQSGLREDEVLIDGVVYKTGAVAVAGLIGYECDYWYEDVDGKRTLRAIIPCASTEYFTLSTMDGDYIADITNSLVEYFPKGQDKKKDIKINSNTSVMYNGAAIDKRLTDLVEYENNFRGTVTYVKNGSKSCVLFVDEYKDYIVKSVNPDTLVMSVEGSNDKIQLSGDNHLVSIIDNNGITKKPGQLAVGDIVTVYQSKNANGPKVTRVYIADTEINGMVTEMRDDVILIDGTEYRKSNLWVDDDSLLGEYAVFALNIYGEAVSADFTSEQSPVTGMFWEYDVVSTSTLQSGEIQIKLIAEDSKTYAYPLASSVTYNGRRFRKTEDLLNTISNCRSLPELTKEEIIRYKLNSKNQIIMIDTRDDLDGGVNDVLKMVDLTGSHKWDVKAGIISKSSSPYTGEYYFPGDALVYTMFQNLDTSIPDADAARDLLCAVKPAKSSILTNENITVTGDLYFLNGDEYTADVLVFQRTNEGLDWNAQLLVSKVFTTLDSERNVCTAISAIDQGGKTNTYLLSKEQFAYPSDITLLSKAQKGDVIRLRIHNSMVVDVNFMLLNNAAASRGTVIPNVSSTTTSSGSKRSRGVYGTVEIKKDNYIVLKTGVDSQGNDILDVVGAPLSVLQCMQNTSGDYIITNSSLINVSEGDKVYAAINSGDTTQLIIYGHAN